MTIKNYDQNGKLIGYTKLREPWSIQGWITLIITPVILAIVFWPVTVVLLSFTLVPAVNFVINNASVLNQGGVTFTLLAALAVITAIMSFCYRKS
jgi:hypothetical protein